MHFLRAPAHPIFVHFTIALTATAFAFDAMGKLLHDSALAASGWWTLAAAVLFTAGALVTGTISRRRVPMAEGLARRFLRWHMAVGPIFFGLLVMLVLWRWTYWSANVLPSMWYLAGLAGALLVMTIQGYLGGELVYAFGVEVRGTYPRLGEDEGSAVGTPAEVPEQ